MHGEKRHRFGKQLMGMIFLYVIFILIGILLAHAPVQKLGLSENVFLNLRMFFIFLGPVYLMVFCKIIGIIKQQTKGERDKPVFVPLAVYLLILESMTLLICIVTFAPLSQTISVAFILTIALTGILIILVPFFPRLQLLTREIKRLIVNNGNGKRRLSCHIYFMCLCSFSDQG